MITDGHADVANMKAIIVHDSLTHQKKAGRKQTV
jgi:hypothetical protein